MFVPEQGRAGIDPANFLGGTAHVDIDDLGSVRNVVLRCGGQHGGVITRNLHADRSAFVRMILLSRDLSVCQSRASDVVIRIPPDRHPHAGIIGGTDGR